MKRILLLFTVCLMFFSSICFAYGKDIPADRVAVGGIHLWDTVKMVRDLHGRPTRVEAWSYSEQQEEKCRFEYYGTGNELCVSRKQGRIIFLRVTSNSQWGTPDKIGIGSSKADVLAIYGPYDPPYSEENRYVYFTKNGNLGFDFENDKVSTIILSYE